MTHHALPLPGNSHPDSVARPRDEDTTQAPNGTCGAPGARKRARRVREAARGNGPVERPEPRPGPTSPPTSASGCRAFVTAHEDWLTVVRLPAYAPELNATEGVWSHLKRGLGNCAATGIDQLVTLVKTRLKRLQYHPELLDGFLGCGVP